MDWAFRHFGKKYAPNTRETIRRQTMHQFVDAGIAVYNPDNPDRAVNSPKAVYQIEQRALALLRTFGSRSWGRNLRDYVAAHPALVDRYAKRRVQSMIPVRVSPRRKIRISPGEHSELIRQIIESCAPRHVPGAVVVYVGDTGDKWSYVDTDVLQSLGLVFEPHGKMPDVVLYVPDRDWLLLIESVTSHRPVDGKRHDELAVLFSKATAGLVYVTAFPNRKAMVRYVPNIAWETEVWVADAPSHFIHFNGSRFLGPYGTS